MELVPARASVQAPIVEGDTSCVTLAASQVKLVAARGQRLAPDMKLASGQVDALSLGHGPAGSFDRAMLEKAPATLSELRRTLSKPRPKLSQRRRTVSQ
jgi:hypothetical protein